MEKFTEWNPVWDESDIEFYENRKNFHRKNITSLKHLRNDLNLSQSDIAKIIDVTQSNVSKMEMRDEDSLKLIKRIARSRGYDLDVRLVPLTD
jgi:DNA-binding XRE family transcriptional regulator